MLQPPNVVLPHVLAMCLSLQGEVHQNLTFNIKTADVISGNIYTEFAIRKDLFFYGLALLLLYHTACVRLVYILSIYCHDPGPCCILLLLKSFSSLQPWLDPLHSALFTPLRPNFNLGLGLRIHLHESE